MKNLIKKLFGSRAGQAFFARLLSTYIKFIYWTNRWEIVGIEHVENYIKQDKPFIACFWHGRLVMMIEMWKWDKPFAMMHSAHQDGQFISRSMSHFGISAIYGSTQRNGTEAVRSVLKNLKKGISIGITPDGPRGPRQIASPGIVVLAKIGKVDIIPMSYATSRRRILKTWDHLHLPLPFGRGVFYYGQPISCSGQNEQVRKAVEDGLNEALNQAELHCGHKVQK